MPSEQRVARQQLRDGGGGGANYPPPSQAENLPCPRCDSTKTKFCYYNNYNLSQPRYFCKACRRYWTQGGNLRNVPVGGGTRKRPRTSSSDSGAKAEVNLSHSVSGQERSFTSLLSSEGLGGYEVGPTTALDEMGQYGRGIWAFPEEGNVAVASGWQMNGGLVDGECFPWPELAISMPGAQGLK